NTSAFVEHLRFVHFTLVIGCLIAMVAATAESRSSATRAYEETKQLLTLAAAMQPKDTGRIWEIVREQSAAIVQEHHLTSDRKVFVNVVPAFGGPVGLNVGTINDFRGLWRLADGDVSASARGIGPSFQSANRANQNEDIIDSIVSNFDILRTSRKIWDNLDR